MKIAMAVGLKIPDSTCATALRTIRKMGYSLDRLKRYDYFAFTASGDAAAFKRQISSTDVLVNVNKNSVRMLDEQPVVQEGEIGIIVQDIDGDSHLLHVLRERLGLTMITGMEKGVLWVMKGDRGLAEEIAAKLLYNPHYQRARFLAP
ncbi:MAG: hypothetical protein V1735_06010 [Nanoarchaeota archaeon]